MTLAAVFLCVVSAYVFLLPRLASTGRPNAKSNILRRLQLRQVALGCVYYFAQYKSWPTNIDNLFPNRNPRHIRAVNESTNDVWGQPIIYEPFDSARGYGFVKSLGRDGKPGGIGFDQDIEIRFDTNRVFEN